MARAYPSRYPLELAMADVVQRCLDAGAGQVDIAVEFAGARSWIRIAADVVPAVVAPGVSAVESPPAVTSPMTPAGLDMVSACMTQGTAVSISPDGATAGHTVVQVEGLHEVLAYKRQEGRLIEAVLERMRSRITGALGLAFHRSLDDGQRRPAPVIITVNAEPVAPCDPLAATAQMMTGMRRHELPFVLDGRVETVIATPHVLTPRDDDASRGRQGFFVYLRDRLVQAGGWSRLSVRDRADAIARVAVDLPAAAVESFVWEAAARRVLFPAALVPALRAVAFEAVSAGVDPSRRLGMASLGGV